jgi:roadblock/LC7 domain-containing protein
MQVMATLRPLDMQDSATLLPLVGVVAAGNVSPQDRRPVAEALASMNAVLTSAASASVNATATPEYAEWSGGAASDATAVHQRLMRLYAAGVVSQRDVPVSVQVS